MRRMRRTTGRLCRSVRRLGGCGDVGVLWVLCSLAECWKDGSRRGDGSRRRDGFTNTRMLTNCIVYSSATHTPRLSFESALLMSHAVVPITYAACSSSTALSVQCTVVHVLIHDGTYSHSRTRELIRRCNRSQSMILDLSKSQSYTQISAMTSHSLTTFAVSSALPAISSSSTISLLMIPSSTTSKRKPPTVENPRLTGT